MISWNYLTIFAVLFFLASCSQQQEIQQQQPLFEKIHPDSSGIDFLNKLNFNQEFNIYTYRNFYNGGGVGLGDINNDGLTDIYLTANQGPNKLYLNKGNFRFEDITNTAGVAGTKAWSTGVSMADVNGDGWLDIYVCNSGDVKGDDKENELFINNGDLTFTEQAEIFGVADKGFTTHAVFFDFDRDHDLDLYILNNSYQAIGSFNLRKNERPKRDELGGDKLMRNDNGHFTDVSEKAGIYGSVIGFGLGATVGDVNKDGWPDLYVSNDFFERDYLYVNQKNGTFKECLTEQMKSISGASMGADLADINNDALPDIFVTEMLPESNERIKTVTTFENWDRYQNAVVNDYYHQFTRNMLQLNNGNSTFSEIGRLSGVEATDWSWGALMFDMDNDGLKDIFVANGIYQDLTNQDYLQYVSSQEIIKSIVANNQVNYKKLVELIPSNPVPDYFFHNQGNLSFVNRAEDWGMGEPNFSNGSAYGDLDNDGDLDLIINRVNETAIVARNNTNLVFPKNRFIQFKLEGTGKNTAAFGTTIEIQHRGQKFYIEQMPNRGFESSVDPKLTLGVGDIDTLDFVKVTWPDGSIQNLAQVSSNQLVTLRQVDAKQQLEKSSSVIPLFEEASISMPVFRHQESDFVDFDRDKLLYHMMTSEGPRISVGDVNADKLDDFFVGGARDSSGKLFLQQSSGAFTAADDLAFEQDKLSEDTGNVLFDADGDGDLDLYVCSGSQEFANISNALSDRLYLNDGKGVYSKSQQLLPTSKLENSSCVAAADYDQDGDLDLFVGIRSEAFQYGRPMSGYILTNNGKGEFTDVSSTVAPGLKSLGLITDAAWVDVDADRDMDLAIVGEYMPLMVFFNENGQFKKQPAAGVTNTSGWWNRVLPADIDRDGDVDLIAANHGLNSRFRASPAKPIDLYVGDFDSNGTTEQILCSYNGDKSYPMVLRHDLMAQIPSLKKKYLKYESYQNQTIHDIFSENELKQATVLSAVELGSGVFVNDGKGFFSFKRFPNDAQLSVMYGMVTDDFDGDGHVDIVMGGNLYRVKPEAGRYDASYGAFLKGDGKGNFMALPARDTGLKIQGEVRDIKVIKIKGEKVLAVARNNDTMLFYKVNAR